MRKIFFAIVFSIMIVLNLISIIFLPITAIATSKTNNSSGYIQIKVLEIGTLKPISDATVCILETRHYTTTNSNGDTTKIKTPLLRNTNFDDVLWRDWGEVTLLIYKQGYASHISFYNEVYAGITRIGIICYLEPQDANNSTLITSNAVLPSSTYLETIVMHYKKN